jgi:transcriptional regulator with XRE-family HTH domain
LQQSSFLCTTLETKWKNLNRMYNSVRNAIGLSQPAFAALLQCTKGQLAMYETGKRPLPAHALWLLGMLQSGAAKAPARPATPAAALAQGQSTWLSKHIRTLDVQLKNKTQAAEICQARIQAAELLLQALQMEGLPALPPTIDASELQLQRELLQTKAAYTLKKLHQKQLQIQLSVCALQAELALASGWLHN